MGSVKEMKVNILKYVDKLNKRNENTERSGRERGMEKLPVAKISRVTGGGGGGGFKPPPPPEIPKALQNRANLNPIVKTVKNC